jgi:ligand-binding sensor domain-containing protein
VFDYNENSLKWVNHTDAFKEHSSHISCFYLDNNNTMWVGSAKLGIAFTDLCAPTFDFVSTGNTEDVSCLMLDHNELLWIGFDGNGMMIKQKNGGITNLKASQQQLPSDIITSMVTLSDGTILAGTYGSGIAKYDGKRFVPIYTDYPILKYIKDIVSDSKGDLWVATVDKGVVKLTPDGKKISYYNNYIVRYKRSIVLYLNYRHIRNAISNLVHYDPETGGSISRPENINGNWNVNGGFTFNTALDSTAHWNIGTDTRMRYNNFVSYVAQEQADAEKNTTRTINLNERLSVGYRNDWLEVTLDGNLNYQHTRNELQPNANLDTWQINYGGQFLVRLPLDFELSMNLHERSHRG